MTAGPELAAQRGDVHVDDVREHVARLAVDVLADRRSRDERPAMADHQLENRVLARGQLDRHVLAIHEPRGPVDGDVADDEHRRGVAAGSPDERAKARHELGDGKRLRKIIVGAEVERLDAIGDGVERRQNQHRRARARLPRDPAAASSRCASAPSGRARPRRRTLRRA